MRAMKNTHLKYFSKWIFGFTFGFLLCTPPLHAQTFLSWQQQTAEKARAAGINDATISKYLMETKENMAVVKLDKRQPEGVLRYGDYLKSVTATISVQ